MICLCAFCQRKLVQNVRSALGPLKNQKAATLCDMSRCISIAQLGKYQFDHGNQVANQPARSDRAVGWQLAWVGSKKNAYHFFFGRGNALNESDVPHHPMPSIDPSPVAITLEGS